MKKYIKCPHIKTPLEMPFCCYLVYSVKVTEIAPWIHHSWVKPASLEWECIPDPASPCRITLWNLSTLPQQDSTSQEKMGPRMAGQQLCSNHTLEADSLRMTEAWGIDSPMGQLDCFYTSYLTVMHCHPLFVSVAVILTIIFAIGQAETASADWTHSERFLFVLFYLFWEWCIVAVYCYWCGFPLWPQSPPPVTYLGRKCHRSFTMTLPKRPNVGELQTTQNPSSTTGQLF
jgi:hypothetical protein